MMLFLKTLNGKALAMEVSLETTVAALKEIVEDRTGMPAAQQRLLLGGKGIEGGESLSSSGVCEGSTLMLTATLNGGAAAIPGAAPPVPAADVPRSVSLYVGDLDEEVNEPMLSEAFAAVAPVSNVRVLRHAVTRRSLGYAYVNFHSVADAEKVMELMNYTSIAGRRIRIMWANRDKSARRSGKGNIYVSSLDPTIESRDLHDAFSMFGNIMSCKVAMDEHGRSRGRGYVQFEKESDALQAIEKANGMRLGANVVAVEKFKPRSERMATAAWTNIYVKHFPREWTDVELRALFEPFGVVSSLKVVTKESNTMGVGFVCFEKTDDAKESVAKLNNKPMKVSITTKAEDGTESTVEVTKPLYVSRAQKKAERARAMASKFEAAKLERLNKWAGMNLYVRHLDESVTEADLSAEFGKFGAISSVRIPKDTSGRSKLFGYVCFTNTDDANKALQAMNGTMMAGKPLYVALWQPKDVRERESRSRQTFGAGGEGFGVVPPMFFGAPMGRGMPMYGRSVMMGGMPMGMMMPPGKAGGRGRGMMYRGAARNVGMPPDAAMMMAMQRQQQYAAAAAAGMMPATAIPSAPMPAPIPAPAADGGMEALLKELADASHEERKNILGERLYKQIHVSQPSLAGKITGMLLDGMDVSELLHLLESPEDCAARIKEAITVLTKMIYDRLHAVVMASHPTLADQVTGFIVHNSPVSDLLALLENNEATTKRVAETVARLNATTA